MGCDHARRRKPCAEPTTCADVLFGTHSRVRPDPVDRRSGAGSTAFATHAPTRARRTNHSCLVDRPAGAFPDCRCWVGSDLNQAQGRDDDIAQMKR